MENGYLVVKQAFSKEKAAEFTKDMWVRLGLDPSDPSTWDRERIHMPWHKREPVATFAPRVSVRPVSRPPCSSSATVRPPASYSLSLSHLTLSPCSDYASLDSLREF